MSLSKFLSVMYNIESVNKQQEVKLFLKLEANCYQQVLQGEVNLTADAILSPRSKLSG